jgi:Uma2 family endonuclease
LGQGKKKFGVEAFLTMFFNESQIVLFLHMPITKFTQLDLTKRYSYADYLTWHFDERVELFNGHVHKLESSPSEEHQRISLILTNKIYNHFDKKPCTVYHAPFDVRLTKFTNDKKITTVVQPDILVVCDETKLDTKGLIGAPDLVVEILSPAIAKKK